MYFRKLPIVLAACVLASAPAIGCKKSGEKQPDPSDKGGAGDPAGDSDTTPAPSGPSGTISGTITLDGEPPEMPLLQRGSDGFCDKTEMRAETVVVGEGGGLQNALVRIAPGQLDATVPESPVVVDQVECMYRPRVQGGMRGQMLEVKNSDQTMHNVKARRLPWGETRDTDTLFNRAQPKNSPPLKGALHESDIYKLSCDSHGWMKGYVIVGDTPYYATSSADGTFTIANVPVGEHELQVWHEYYGVKTGKAVVEAGKSVTVDFTFDAEADKPASAGGE